MKYVLINSVPNGSTGGIMFQIKKEREGLGDECWAMWGRGRAAQDGHEFNFGSKIGFYLDVLQTRIDGRAGFHSKSATRKLLAKLDEIEPDIVHLHNLHGYYVNIEMLFDWLASHECKVVWTLHDCWAFTGHCAHFTYVKCAQWQTHCAHSKPCLQLSAYPKTISKASCSRNFEDKKRLFTSVSAERMTLVTPSQWLANLVEQSFLAGYPTRVLHNTIDSSVFKPTPSEFRERHGIGERFMILGVASPWTERKGLDDFVRLAGEIDDRFVIVLVGLNKRQIAEMPDCVIASERTGSKRELAEIYSSADVFFNPTREDNYPTVNLEAQACGTPVVSYDVGGCRETLYSPNSKVVSSYQDALRAIRSLADI